MDITITMTEPEIKDAICGFLLQHDVISKNKEIEVNMVAGRGSNGHSAVISVKNAVPALVGQPQAGIALEAQRNQVEHPATENPAKEDPALYKQQETPAQTIPVNKDVPMPGASSTPAQTATQAPGEDVTAKATESVANLFGDDPVQTEAQPPQEQVATEPFDENNITEGGAGNPETVDSLFG